MSGRNLLGMRGTHAHAAGRSLGVRGSTIVVALALLVFLLPAQAIQTPTQTATAVVLVNSASEGYPDFARYIKPYLDHFGVPYRVTDLATQGLPANLAQHALVVIGHGELDLNGAFLDASEQAAIAAAVQQGTGIVNFDFELTAGGVPAYQYVQDIFGFDYSTGTSSSSVAVQSSAAVGGYVLGMQSANATYTLQRSIVPQGVGLASNSSALMLLGGQPLLVARQYGAGRALQWTSYEWMRADTWGYVRGWDDLIWRGVVWGARKPFVMQGMPPFVTMRVDDTTGPYWWTDAATQHGFKPWLGFFLDEQDTNDVAAIKSLVDAGKATASVHARTNTNFFYFDHNFGDGHDLPDSVVAQNFADATNWHIANQIPISKFVLPHYYEFGTNVFGGLQQWGVEFVGTVILPGTPYPTGQPGLQLGPYRKFEVPCDNCLAPFYYADLLSIPGHPEFDGRFFNTFMEVRDDAGYEWFPSGDVPQTVGRAIRQMKRGLTGMNLATLFTHEYHIQFIPPDVWSTIMGQVATGIAPFGPEYVTMDDAVRYVRAVYTSNIDSSVYDPDSGILTTTLTGGADIPTRFYLFTEPTGQVQSTFVAVPAFSGSTVVPFDVGSTPQPSTISIADASVTEGNSGQTNATFTVTLSPAANAYVTVNFATSNGSATAPGDYTATSGTVTFSPGETTRPIDVPVIGDTTPELDETFIVVLSGPVNAVLGDGTGTGTILNDDGPLNVPALSINDVTVAEGNSGTTNAVFTVTLSAAPGTATVTVNYATGNGTAVAPGDYTATSGTLTFTGSTTAQAIAVPVVGDLAVEPDETFTVTLSGASGAVIADGSGTGTISNDDGVGINVWEDAHQEPVLPTTSDGAALNETDNAWTEFLWPARGYPGVFAAVGETPPLMRFFGPVANGTYAVFAGLYWNSHLRYYWGPTVADPEAWTVDVTSGVAGDFAEYALGSVSVTNGVFELYTRRADALPGGGSYPFYGWAWIRLVRVGDPVPALSIDDVSVVEGNSGTTNAVFTVTLSAAPGTATVTVNYATGNGTAVAPGDYTATSGTLTFTGSTTTQPIAVPVVGDTAVEPDETFTVTLSGASGATIVDGSGTGTISNDDLDSGPPAIGISDVTVIEGDSTNVAAVFTLTLSRPSTQSISVNYATANGTAVASADYTARTGTVTFSAGSTTRTVSITVRPDLRDEFDEVFYVNLSAPVNATIADNQGAGTIIDNDPEPSLSIDDVTVTEGNTGTKTVTFTVRLSAPSNKTITVVCATANGTAVAPDDYMAKTDTLTFGAGATSRSFKVTIRNDRLVEPNETFFAVLSGAVNASIARPQGTATIVDND